MIFAQNIDASEDSENAIPMFQSWLSLRLPRRRKLFHYLIHSYWTSPQGAEGHYQEFEVGPNSPFCGVASIQPWKSILWGTFSNSVTRCGHETEPILGQISVQSWAAEPDGGHIRVYHNIIQTKGTSFVRNRVLPSSKDMRRFSLISSRKRPKCKAIPSWRPVRPFLWISSRAYI